ncbi:MAG: RNA pyrophosphohydrolase, partial [Neisseriaceae bacterium]|nr:RNA pyrophosphohydrolase [Neisseriaceae bacterium]
VEIINRTNDWIYYDVPKKWLKKDSDNFYKGQKQIWFLLRFVGRNSDISLRATSKPEFDGWRWNGYWNPIREIIDFKKEVYQAVLQEFAPILGIDSDTNQK